jgi:hypothetical protein
VAVYGYRQCYPCRISLVPGAHSVESCDGAHICFVASAKSRERGIRLASDATVSLVAPVSTLYGGCQGRDPAVVRASSPPALNDGVPLTTA